MPWLASLVDRLPQVEATDPLLWWLLGSILAYVLGANLLWLARDRMLCRTKYGRWFGQVVQFFYYLGVPYLVLGGWPRPPFSALLLPEDMGLVGWNPPWPATRWLQSMSNGLGLGVVALLFLGFAWRSANRGVDEQQLMFPRRPAWALMQDSLYLQVHWAFYRGAAAVLLEDAYVGVFVGLGLVCLEWGLDPFWRRSWRMPGEAGLRWLRVGLVLISALIYLLTLNTWACLLVHGLGELAFSGLQAVVSPEPPSGVTLDG
jgi:hypothetical protein